jgi:hypothetical protein
MTYSKYGNRKTGVDGNTFDSKKEAERYVELKLLEKGGVISGLELQPKFELQKPFFDKEGKKHRAITYIADFQYLDKKTGKLVVEDVKGRKTEVYKIKKKLFVYKYPNITFLET